MKERPINIDIEKSVGIRTDNSELTHKDGSRIEK